MLDRWRDARADKDQELDLIPVMNLMVTLIPFLLLGAAFYHLGVIPTSLPNNVSASDSPPPTEIKVSMILAITSTEMTVSGSVTGPDPDENEAIKATLAKTYPAAAKCGAKPACGGSRPNCDFGKCKPCPPGVQCRAFNKYETAELQAHLVKIKKEHPKSDTILIKPEDEIRYEILVDIIDHVRVKQLEEMDKDGNPKMMDLFPVAVFTTLNKVLPDGGVEGDGGVEDAP